MLRSFPASLALIKHRNVVGKGWSGSGFPRASGSRLVGFTGLGFRVFSGSAVCMSQVRGIASQASGFE